jgi:hypothetical protein
MKVSCRFAAGFPVIQNVVEMVDKVDGDVNLPHGVAAVLGAARDRGGSLTPAQMAFISRMAQVAQMTQMQAQVAPQIAQMMAQMMANRD